jgi:hypothetical protein
LDEIYTPGKSAGLRKGSIVYACYFHSEVLHSRWMTFRCNGMIALIH